MSTRKHPRTIFTDESVDNPAQRRRLFRKTGNLFYEIRNKMQDAIRARAKALAK